MIVINSIFRLFNVQTGERRLVSLLLIHSFFVGITLTFTDTAAYTLFLSHFDAQILPVSYIIASSVTIVVGVVYAWLETRTTILRLLTVNLIVISTTLIVFRAFYSFTDASWPALAGVIGFDVLWVLSSLEFWGLSGRVFNVRQGKRLFGLIGSGEMLSTIIGGATVPLLVRFLHPEDFFVLAAVGAFCSLLVMRVITRRYLYGGRLKDQEEDNPSERTPRQLLRERYILLIFLTAALAVATLYFVDNAFYNQAERQFINDSELAAFLGLFLSITAFLQLLCRAFLSGWVLGRFGVRIGLLVLPLSLGLGAIAVISLNQAGVSVLLIFIFIVITKGLDKAFRFSVNRASSLVLYQPLAAGERLWAQAASESIIEPIAGITGGVILLALNTVFRFDAVQLLTALLILIIAWIAIILVVNREYTLVLIKALSRRKLSGNAVALSDSSSLSILKKTLSSSYPGEVIYALHMLETADYRFFKTVLNDLLHHPSIEVRMQALNKVERHQVIATQSTLIDMLVKEPTTQLRSKVLQVLPMIESASVVIPYLDHPDSQIKLGAIVGLLKHIEGEGVEYANAKLLAYSKSEKAIERIFSTQVIYALGRADLHVLLGSLLRDPDTHVRRAALTAAGKIHHPDLIPLLIENLASHEGAFVVVNALSSIGEATLPHLTTAFEKSGQPREVLVRILRIISRIKSNQMTIWLRDKINYPDESVRYYILLALKACNYQASQADEPFIEKQLEIETIGATWTLAAMLDIGNDESVGLLYRALQQEFEITRKRILVLLSFMYDTNSINSVRENYNHPSKEKRAYAIEVLDTTINQELKPSILPLMEATSLKNQLHVLNDIYPQEQLSRAMRIQQICNEKYENIHPWTKTCALYTAAMLENVQLSGDVVASLSDPDPIVQETALWALYQVARSLYRLHVKNIREGKKTSGATTLSTITQIENEIHGKRRMLLTIEKVIILKTVSIFAETSEDLLAEIALILEELDAEAGHEFIKKGDIGNCMYIIAQGRVYVHDGERVIARLGEREVVGELALLDSEPRNASVTAEEQTLLLKLDQEPFYELIANNPEVVQGIMRVLTRRLRAATA